MAAVLDKNMELPGDSIGTAEKAAVGGVERVVARKALGMGSHVVLGRAALGLAGAGIFTTVIDQSEHHQQNLAITDEYRAEIAAKLGKPMQDVKIHDMVEVAKKNPVLAKAYGDSIKRRNISVASSIVGIAGGIALGGIIAPLILPAVGGALTVVGLHTLVTSAGWLGAQSIAAAVGGALAYAGVQTVTEKVAENHYKLNEPSLTRVEHHLAKQESLSVSSQVTHLAHLQARRKPISQMQVMTLFVSANPELADQVKSRFGESFSRLAPGSKEMAIKELAPQIESLTNDINNGHMRAQGLAFAAYGQDSGVKRIESGSIAEVLRPVSETPSVEQAAAQPQGKLAFLKSKVTAMIPGMQKTEVTAAPPPSTKWQDYLATRQSPQAALTGNAL